MPGEICNSNSAKLYSKSEDRENSKNPNQPAIRAAIYARISSPNQKFNSSIREQITSCRKYIRQKGWETSYIFFDEESGKNIDRPRFQLMLEKARLRCFNVIVFWKLDRFCRSLADLVNVERKLREYEVGLSSVTEYVDTTSSIGRFNFRSIGSVAELERELIGERARLGLHALAKEYRWPNPHPPLGYSKKENGRLAPNGDAKTVLKIYKMYLKSSALPQVAFNLNEKRIATQNGKKWNASTVRNVLVNKIYIGRYSVAGVTHYVEEYRIMPDDLFLQVERTLARYKTGVSQRPPMPKDRRNTEIDSVFNQFLANINPTENEVTESKHFRTKVVRDTENLFQLLQDGWELVRINDEKYTLRKPVNKAHSYTVLE